MDSNIVRLGVTQPHRKAVNEVLAALGTNARSGLSLREAQERLERQGKNELAAARPFQRGESSLPSSRTSSSSYCSLPQLSPRDCGCISATLRYPMRRLRSSPIVLLNAIMGYA
jgi:hypothetical protein